MHSQGKCMFKAFTHSFKLFVVSSALLLFESQEFCVLFMPAFYGYSFGSLSPLFILLQTQCTKNWKIIVNTMKNAYE